MTPVCVAAAEAGFWITVAIAGMLLSHGACDDDDAEDSRTAGEIISQDKKGSINQEFPEEMRGLTKQEIEARANQGSAAAKKAWKLLGRKKYDKRAGC